MTCEGRVWKFGDDVNTDLIIPGRYLDNYDPDHLAKHAMEGISKDFASEASPGDVIVAGSNFGCGSSREQAVVALRGHGVKAIVAVSFARIFYRNAINLGMHVYQSPEAHSMFADGDVISLDSEKNRLRSVDGSREVMLADMPTRPREIVDSGGLIPYVKHIMLERKV